MKSMFNLSILVLLALLFTQCSSSDTISSSISDANLAGTVFGEVFTAEGGKAFDSGDNISINITNTNADCDTYISDYDIYVSTTVLFEVGTYDNSNVVFHKKDGTPNNVLQSTVVIEKITATTVTVKIASESFDGESKVDGTFTVNYCSQ